MCVKEFLGYACGHCSVPFLRQCPISASQPMFPPCKFPAERPIFANENCHPCSRVLWNIKVLREEEEHRQQHRRQECECKVVFDAEERERRLRPRPSSNKAKNKEIMAPEQQLYGNQGESSRAGGMGSGRLASEPSVVEPSGYRHRHDIEEPSVPMTQNYNDHDQYEQQAFNETASSQAGPIQQTRANSVYDIEYVGYFVNRGTADMNHAAQGNGFPPEGVVPEESYWRPQAQLGEVGAGMKWYPQPSLNLPPLPAPPAAPAPAAPRVYPIFEHPRPWQKAKSEPYYPNSPDMTLNKSAVAETTESEAEHESETQDEDVPSAPMVVSSDMALPISS